MLWEKEGMYNAVVAHTENYNICTAYRVKWSRLFALPLMAGSEGQGINNLSPPGIPVTHSWHTGYEAKA